MKNATCTHGGCADPYYSNDYCRLHFGRWYNGRPMDAPPAKNFKPPAPCSVDGCDDLSHLRDLCTKHYRRWQRHGDATANMKFRSGVEGLKLVETCEIDGCLKDAYIRDLCSGHYARWQRARNIRADVPLEPRRSGAWACTIETCELETSSGSWCPQHYRQRISLRLRRKRLRLKVADPGSYAAMRVRERERSREWIAKNPEQNKTLELRKRAKRAAAPRIRFTGQQLAARMTYWGNRCWMCDGPFEEVDHVKPIAKGGWHALANLRPACFKCNNQKSDKWPVLVSPQGGGDLIAA